MKENIMVLYGGQSGEHEISLRSAASVIQHLDANRYEVIPVAIDKQGRFFLNQYGEMRQYPDALPVKTALSIPIESLISHGQSAIKADVIFPVMHGPLYEDGCIQGLLESLSVAYVGSGVMASSIGMDKDMARIVACRDDILHTPYVCLTTYQTEQEQQASIQALIKRNQWPLFVKPSAMGSSVGIHKVANGKSLAEAIKDAFRFDCTVLVEDAIKGQEIEVAVLETLEEDRPIRASTPGEILTHHQDGFYSYQAKYLQSDETELLIPAKLSPSMTKQVQKAAIRIFRSLKCQGLARVDFFIADDKIYFNEINTLPGFTSISMYPKLLQHDNLSYPDLLDQLILVAKKHHLIKANRLTDYQ